MFAVTGSLMATSPTMLDAETWQAFLRALLTPVSWLPEEILKLSPDDVMNLTKEFSE